MLSLLLAIPFNDKMKIPVEMNIQQIKETILAFQRAALRSKQAGFDVIELHGAHGYLINEFYHHLLINERINTAAHLKTAIVSYAKLSTL